MDDKRALLKHFLAALAYRTQKALRDAPPEFAKFRAAPQVRTPHELISHMDSVLGYSRTFFLGGAYRPPAFPDFSDAIAHFHEVLADVAHHIEVGTETIPVIAHIADEAERAPIWEAQKRDNPGFADYESKTSRQIPVILLRRAS